MLVYFIRSLDYKRTIKFEIKPKPEESVRERTKLRKHYFKYLSPVDMYKNLNESITTDKNKLQANLLEIALINLKKTLKIHLNIIQIKLKRTIK